MYVNANLKRRVLLAREIDKIFFEKENKKRSHKWVYEHYTRDLLGTSYDTFLAYLNSSKYETPNITPSKEVLDLLKHLRDVRSKMKENEKK